MDSKKDVFKKRINNEEEFIFSKKYDYNIKNLLERYKEGCSNKIICTVLLLKNNELNKIYNKIIVKLKNILNVDKGQ